jgi:hypothetical protein
MLSLQLSSLRLVAQKLCNVNSALWEIKFQQPGQLTEAFVKGFGAVFSDVDTEQTTSLEFLMVKPVLENFSFLRKRVTAISLFLVFTSQIIKSPL